MHVHTHTRRGETETGTEKNRERQRDRDRQNKLFPSPCLNFPFLAFSIGLFYILHLLCLVSASFNYNSCSTRADISSCLVCLHIPGPERMTGIHKEHSVCVERKTAANLMFLWLSVLWAGVPMIIGLSFSTSRIYSVTTRKNKTTQEKTLRASGDVLSLCCRTAQAHAQYLA